MKKGDTSGLMSVWEQRKNLLWKKKLEQGEAMIDLAVEALMLTEEAGCGYCTRYCLRYNCGVSDYATCKASIKEYFQKEVRGRGSKGSAGGYNV